MMTEKTLGLLVNNLEKILALAEEEKFSNLRLLIPNRPDDWNKINLVVDLSKEDEEEGIDMLTLSYVEEEISKLLDDCPVMLVASSMIRWMFKDSLLESAFTLKVELKEELKEFWQQNLLPLLKKFNNWQLTKSTSDEESEYESDITETPPQASSKAEIEVEEEVITYRPSM